MHEKDPEGNPSNGPTVEQRLAMSEELLTAVRLIQAGLGQLQQHDGGNDFYHLPLLTLSSGFERMMKLVICLRELEQTGQYPVGAPWPNGRKGHDLEKLLERIQEACISEEYIADVPVGRQDIALLRSADLRRFVKVLGDFGQAARYHNLDLILGERTSADSPEQAWQAVETAILLEREDLMHQLDINRGANDVHIEINREIVIRLERFARALARLFTIGGLGDQAQHYAGIMRTFLFIEDSQLGTRRYPSTGIPG